MGVVNLEKKILGNLSGETGFFPVMLVKAAPGGGGTEAVGGAELNCS